MALDYSNMKKRLELTYSNEDGVADAWNKFVDEQTKNMPSDKPIHHHKVYRNTPQNIMDVPSVKSEKIGATTYDADKLNGMLEVRMAEEGEKLTTLDNIERVLTSNDIVISDGKEPIGLAGVMGGLDTEVTENTKNVVIIPNNNSRVLIVLLIAVVKVSPYPASLNSSLGFLPPIL